MQDREWCSNCKKYVPVTREKKFSWTRLRTIIKVYCSICTDLIKEIE